MTTPTAESMKKAHSILIEGESVADQVEAIALALDNAHAAGRAEGLKAAEDALRQFAIKNKGNWGEVFINGVSHSADMVAAIDSLAPAKTKGTE